GMMKDRNTKPRMPLPELLVNIKTIPELREIGRGPGRELVIGATATLSEIEQHPVVRARFAALAEAARLVATLQIREVGTIGGNLCPRPWRCSSRHPQFVSFMRGGLHC